MEYAHSARVCRALNSFVRFFSFFCTFFSLLYVFSSFFCTFFSWAFFVRNFHPLGYLYGFARYTLLFKHLVLFSKYILKAFYVFLSAKIGCWDNNILWSTFYHQSGWKFPYKRRKQRTLCTSILKHRVTRKFGVSETLSFCTGLKFGLAVTNHSMLDHFPL